jgi:hypothetical protein
MRRTANGEAAASFSRAVEPPQRIFGHSEIGWGGITPSVIWSDPAVTPAKAGG